MFILFFNYGLILNYLTGSISHFYHFSITAALRISAKKDIFRMGESEKLSSRGSSAAAGIEGLEAAGTGKRSGKIKCMFIRSRSFTPKME